MACCPTLDDLCDACVEHWCGVLRGAAQRRGETWARHVALSVDRSTPWPATSARCRSIARRKVEDLARDRRLIERLADEAIAGASRWWSQRDVR